MISPAARRSPPWLCTGVTTPRRVGHNTAPLYDVSPAKVTGDVDSLVAEVAGTGPMTVICGRGEASAIVVGLRPTRCRGAEPSDGMEVGAARRSPRDFLRRRTVIQYRRPSSGCLGYMIISDGSAAVVDPLRAFTDRYSADAADRDASITHAIDTHVHADHISGVRRLAVETGASRFFPYARSPAVSTT